MTLLIGLGGIVGALLRFYLGKWIVSIHPRYFAWATCLINVSGSFLLGALYTMHLKHQIGDVVWLAAGTGFCGGYTTFSTFGVETIQFMERKRYLTAAAYVVVSVVLSVSFCWLGVKL